MLKSVPRNRYPNRDPMASNRHCAGQVTPCSCRIIRNNYQNVPVKSIVRIMEPDEAANVIPEMLVREAYSEKYAVSSTQTPFKAFQIQYHDSLPGTDAQVVLSTWDTLDTLPA